MTPLLILIFGIQPTTAIGTDIFYSAVTKTVGGWRHFRMKTVNMELVKWLAFGSVPAAVLGVWPSSRCCEKHDRRRPARLARLRGARRHPADGRDHHPGPGADPAATWSTSATASTSNAATRSPPWLIGATTGFVIGITSAGSGTVIAILLIAVYRLAPKKVVGTDVFHAAMLLWAAGIAHWVGGNVDFVLAGNILIGSIPGVVIGAALSDRRRRASSARRSASSWSAPASSRRSRRATRTSGRSPPRRGDRARRRSSPRRTGSTGAASAKRQQAARPLVRASAGRRSAD